MSPSVQGPGFRSTTFVGQAFRRNDGVVMASEFSSGQAHNERGPMDSGFRRKDEWLRA